MNCIVDVETTTIDNGHPFNPDNKLVVTGFLPCDDEWNRIGKPIYAYDKESLKETFQKFKTLCLHNAKFDLHWIRKHLGLNYSRNIIRDTQVAEFLLTNQLHKYSALEELAIKYFNEHKIDNIKINYWDKGIDTISIPKDELEEYLEQDLELTRKIYKEQETLLKAQNKFNLFKLQMADLITLQEKEYNGMLFDREKSIENSKELETKALELATKVGQLSNIPDFNLSSNDQLSLLLFGGIHIAELRIPVGVFKTGKHIGEPRYKIFKETIECPRLFEPPKGSELKKKGFFSTDEATLLSLKPKNRIQKELLTYIQEYNKIQKRNGTYFKGLPKLIETKNWQDNIIHGQLNQCVAITGRLSSSKPNQQNFDPEAKKLCVSRYND